MEFTEDKIIYEDNHLMVINKDAGLLSQEDSSGDMDVLTLVKDFIKVRDNKPGNVYLGLVHRLDRNTGGVMCLAKTSKAASRLSEQIRKKEWDKYYLSLNESNEALKPWQIDGEWEVYTDELSKDEESNTSSRVKANTGKKSSMESRILAQIPYHGYFLNLRENKLITGRSHQIRVQLAGRNESIVGDYKYRARRNSDIDRHFLGLWASKLTIQHPTTKETMIFSSIPKDYSVWMQFNFDELYEKYDLGNK